MTWKSVYDMLFQIMSINFSMTNYVFVFHSLQTIRRQEEGDRRGQLLLEATEGMAARPVSSNRKPGYTQTLMIIQ